MKVCPSAFGISLTSVFSFQFLLGTLKFATRDPMGMGIEYDGGKPGKVENIMKLIRFFANLTSLLLLYRMERRHEWPRWNAWERYAGDI